MKRRSPENGETAIDAVGFAARRKRVLVHPQLAAALRIEGIGVPVAAGQVHDAIHHERHGLKFGRAGWFERSNRRASF